MKGPVNQITQSAIQWLNIFFYCYILIKYISIFFHYSMYLVCFNVCFLFLYLTSESNGLNHKLIKIISMYSKQGVIYCSYLNWQSLLVPASIALKVTGNVPSGRGEPSILSH